MIGDLGHTSSDTAERFRKNWLNPHFNAIPQQPLHVRDSLKRYLDNLQSLSLQDFFKTLTILETISSFMQWMTSNLRQVRAIDIRKMKLIIDDQTRPTLISLRHFVHYFLQL
jgi:hypothetical protein